MKITSVNVRKIEKEGSRMKGIASVLLDDSFAVHDIRIIESDENGLFIAMPSRKTPDGEFKDIAHPINTDTREKMQSSILAAFEEAMKEKAGLSSRCMPFGEQGVKKGVCPICGKETETVVVWGKAY